MLDAIITKYEAVQAHIVGLIEHLDEHNEVPNAHLPGAPSTVGEARHAAFAGLVIVEQVLQDLKIAQMENEFQN